MDVNKDPQKVHILIMHICESLYNVLVQEPPSNISKNRKTVSY